MTVQIVHIGLVVTIFVVFVFLLDLWPSPFIILDREISGTFHAFVTYKHDFLVGFAWPMSQMFVYDELKVYPCF